MLISKFCYLCVEQNLSSWTAWLDFFYQYGRATVFPVSISDTIVAPTSVVRSFVIGLLATNE